MSVHLGEEYGAVELPADEISEERLGEAEKLANDVIRAGDPVQIMFVTPEEASKLPLRKVPKFRERLRIIRVGDFDWSACGGTHCSSTAEVGMIKIIATERLRKRTLVKFLAGDKAFEDYSMRFDVTAALSRELTCHVTDLPEKFQKLDDELVALRREISAIRKDMLPSQAEDIARSQIEVSGSNLATAIVEALDAKLATQLAALVADKIEGIALLFADGRLVMATAESSGLHAGNLAKQLSEKSGLRGGGGANQAQLGGAEFAQFDRYVSQLKAILGDG
jgi:alanyl-tRNA synthetase